MPLSNGEVTPIREEILKRLFRVQGQLIFAKLSSRDWPECNEAYQRDYDEVIEKVKALRGRLLQDWLPHLFTTPQAGA